MNVTQEIARNAINLDDYSTNSTTTNNNNNNNITNNNNKQDLNQINYSNMRDMRDDQKLRVRETVKLQM
jgi:hypothetical protein